MSKINAGDIITKAALFGFGGWFVENAICSEERHSAVFGSQKVPFLPVYAVGGIAMTSAAPYISKWPTIARGLSYAAIGTAIEYIGCKIDRELLHSHTWDYGKQDALAVASGGCVNFSHSALWGGLGLIAEKFTNA